MRFLLTDKGWYVQDDEENMYGPYKTREQAETAVRLMWEKRDAK